MAKGRDIVGMLRGLEKVVQSLVEHQQKEVSRLWRNSSVRSALQDAETQAEEKFSDILVSQDSGSKLSVSDVL